MTSASQRQRRIADIRKRIVAPQDAYEQCRAFPCTNRTTADRGEGLNRLYCRTHIEFYRRHGSYVKRSYSAAELRPYRIKAAQWLRERGDLSVVQRAKIGVVRLLQTAGAPIEAFRLAGKKPAERARALWASLRVKGVDPAEILAVWLAVDMRLRDDPQPDRHREYRYVQVAKLIHRMAGGSHRRWEHERSDGSVQITEMHRHPVSRGRVLLLVGKQLSDLCEVLESPS